MLKILFICAGLEPAKDGVGDYTRKLAAALCRSNCPTAIIALNDRYITDNYISLNQQDDNMTIPVLRFSRNCLWQERTQKSNAFIQSFKPDLISLQYVPYGFNKKGLPFNLPALISEIGKNCNWHIMFHEMWIGISNISPLSHRIYGFFQKKIAVALIKRLNPKKITTTNRLYQLVLQEKNIHAAIVPLFSNISIVKKDEAFMQYIESRYQVKFNSDSFFFLGVFGTLYPYADLPSKIPEFLISVDKGKEIVILFFGRNNHPQELDKIKNVLPAEIKIIQLGELDECRLTAIFSVLNEAVLCTPIEHIGKSGAYAALRFHQVNVTIPASQPVPKYKADIDTYNLYLKNRAPEEWSVEYITGQFLNYLQNSND